MIVVIQTVPQRRHLAERIEQSIGIPCIRNTDTFLRGTLWAFKNGIKEFHSPSDYRVHVQDDMVFSDNIAEYLPHLQGEMERQGIDYLSLYASRRREFNNALRDGKRIFKGRIYKFVHLTCAIFSPKLCSHFLENIDEMEGYPDDWFASFVMRKHRISAYYHIPSLAQHDISVPSIVGNNNNPLDPMRTSGIFDKDFVNKWKSEKSITPIT